MIATKTKSIEKAETAKDSPARISARQPVPASLQSALGLTDVQQAAGNFAMQSLARSGTIQAKLTVSQPGDLYEQEADRVAEQVMRMPTPPSMGTGQASVQRQTPEVGEVGPTKPLATTITPLVQRAPSDSLGSFEPGTDFEARLSTGGGGSPLPASTRAFMEPRFGADFSGVRLHAGSEAAQLNRAVSAEAFTHRQDVYLGEGKKNLGSSVGKKLLAHELTHVIQQTGSPPLQTKKREEEVAPSGPEPSIHSVQRSQRLILQRQETTAPTGQAVGEAVRPEVESLLKAFASASGYEAKNTAAMQAVSAVIRAYGLSTKGLSGMRFEPGLDPAHDAEAAPVEGKGRQSRIDFGPGSFNKGFEYFVHVVAHELEHVRQQLIGGYREGDDPVTQFLAYSGEVLQVGNTAGRSDRGLIGALKTAASENAPALPPLPPALLARVGRQVLSEWQKMSSEEQRKYRQEFAGARDKLLERLTKEAPRALRPPTKFTPEWRRWFEGQPPNSDPFTIEYQDWLDASKSPWTQVKDVWKQFDAWFRV